MRLTRRGWIVLIIVALPVLYGISVLDALWWTAQPIPIR